MRAFWASMCVLCVAAVLWLVLGRSPGAVPVAPAAAPAEPSPTGRAAAPAAKPMEAPEKEPEKVIAEAAQNVPPPIVPAVEPSTPAETARIAPPAQASAPSAPAQTGFSQATIEAAFTKSFPVMVFKTPPPVDGRRRVFGTLGEATMPALEMVGDPADLSQITAMGRLVTDDGPATADGSPFAVRLLEVVMPAWSESRAWLADTFQKAAAAEASYTADHSTGGLNVHFSSWKSLGVYRVSVESVKTAQATAAAANLTEKVAAPATEAAAPKAESAPAAEASKEPVKSSGSAKVEAKADGVKLVDGKYEVKGSGTKEDPYKVTWDQLVSAQDEYVPREGRKEVPGRVMMLNDAWVEITGYIAFPLMVDSPDECLAMMNQWDGCCIGVPPTPYDAVEVRLTGPLSGNARLTTYGTVRGRFKVDPHLVGGWLVGLYVMDQTTLTPQTYGGVAP